MVTVQVSVVFRQIPTRIDSNLCPMVKTVLVADHNAFVRQALRMLLTRELGVEVSEAKNGREAIEKAQELKPDLIVLDLSMPVMNGLEAGRVIKISMPAVPIIMYSAFVNEFAKKEAHSVGISELVSKSEHASVLIRKARRLLYPPAA